MREMPHYKAVASGNWHGSSDVSRNGACRPAHHCRRHTGFRADAERRTGGCGSRHGARGGRADPGGSRARDRKSTRLNSSHTVISYAVFCLKKKKIDDTIDALGIVERGQPTVESARISE